MKNLFGSDLFVLVFIIKLISARDIPTNLVVIEEDEGYPEDYDDSGQEILVQAHEEENKDDSSNNDNKSKPDEINPDSTDAVLEPVQKIAKDLYQNDNKSYKKNQMLMIGGAVVLFFGVLAISCAIGNKEKKSIKERKK